MKKKLKLLIMLIATIQTLVVSLVNYNVYANDFMDIVEKIDTNNDLGISFGVNDGSKFKEQQNKYIYLSKKVDDEKNNYTGMLDKEKEDRLNECGILDEEIMALNEDDWKLIQNSAIDELVIMTSVYKCHTDDTNGETTMVELSYEEIDELYEEKYYSGGNDEIDIQIQKMYSYINEQATEFQNNRAITKDIVTGNGSNSGIISNRIHTIPVIDIMQGTSTAISSTLGSYSETKSGSYLKKSLYAVCNKSTGIINVTYTTMWLSMPEQRMMDAIYIYWEGLEHIAGTKCVVTHKVYETYIEFHGKMQPNGSYPVDYSSSKWKKTQCTLKQGKYIAKIRSNLGSEFEVTTETYDINSTQMYIFTSLHNDNVTYEYINGSTVDFTAEAYCYTNETIIVELALADTTDVNMEIGSTYHHFYIKEEYEYKYNFSAITSAIVSFTSAAQTYSKIGIAIGVIDAINSLSQYEEVTVKNQIKSQIIGPDFTVYMKFVYK